MLERTHYGPGSTGSTGSTGSKRRDSRRGSVDGVPVPAQLAAVAEVRTASSPRLSIVVPALNEADNIGPVLSRIPLETFEVILVDGWSSDTTIKRALAARPDLRVMRQTRYGKGNALACGFAACRGDIIVMLDADGSADPAEIPRFVDALQAGAHFAKGTRFADGGSSEDITVIRRSGNWCLNRLVNTLYRTRYTDLCYGYMAFWASSLPTLAVVEDDPRCPRADAMRWGDGFEIETLITVRAAAGGLVIAEVGSVEAPRVYGVSNLNAFSDGWRVLRTIAAENYRLRRTGGAVDVPISVGAGSADAVKGEAADHGDGSGQEIIVLGDPPPRQAPVTDAVNIPTTMGWTSA